MLLKGAIIDITRSCYTTNMTDKPILNFTIDPALLSRIDAFWHANAFSNRATAIKWLLDWSLTQNPKPNKESKKTK